MCFASAVSITSMCTGDQSARLPKKDDTGKGGGNRGFI